MTLALTSLTNGSTAPTTLTGYTTASVSPAGGSVLFLASGGFDGNTVQDFTISSVSGLGLAWSKVALTGAGSADKGDVEVWTAACGATPGSGAITVALTGSGFPNGGMAWAVDQVTGQGGTPVVAGSVKTANASNSSVALTFNTAGSPSNLFYLASVVLVGTGNTITQTPDETPAWTALDNLQSSTTANNGAAVLTQVSPSASNVNGSAALDASHSWGAIGLEIAASAGGANITAQLASALAAQAPALSGSERIAGALAAQLAPAAAAARGVARQNVTGELAAAAAPLALHAGRRRRGGSLPLFTGGL